MTLGRIVRRVSRRVRRSSGNGRDVVDRALVHFRPDHREAEPQRQRGAEQAS